MNIDFNFPLKSLDGEPLQDENGKPIMVGKILASQLVNQSGGDVLKMFDWALALNRGEPLNLDTSDQQTLKKFITESGTMTILLKRYLLDAMDGRTLISAQ